YAELRIWHVLLAGTADRWGVRRRCPSLGSNRDQAAEEGLIDAIGPHSVPHRERGYRFQATLLPPWGDDPTDRGTLQCSPRTRGYGHSWHMVGRVSPKTLPTQINRLCRRTKCCLIASWRTKSRPFACTANAYRLRRARYGRSTT